MAKVRIMMNGKLFAEMDEQLASGYVKMMQDCGKKGEKLKDDRSNAAFCAQQKWDIEK